MVTDQMQHSENLQYFFLPEPLVQNLGKIARLLDRSEKG